jgi:SAM-dependent methyltransferase
MNSGNTGTFVDATNRAALSTVVTDYRWSDELQVSERAALDTIRASVRGKRILDLGVGAGRTVTGLREVSANYIGVDYMQEMVDHCRERFPDVRFERVDARSMPQFADASFDLIVFSCNGICMVDHAGRLSILKEVRRLLAPGGWFLFSTSNRNDPDHGRFLLPAFRFTLNPVRLLARAIRFVSDVSYSAFNRFHRKKREVRRDDYAILNDRSHHYRTMNYFITLEKQLEQLRELGFAEPPRVFDLAGQLVTTDTRDGTMTFIVRRP